VASSNLKNLKDEELIILYKNKKSTEAFGILYDRYAHLVYGTCLKILKDSELAKDSVMQIFEKLFTDIYRHEIKIFKAWLYRVSQNHCFLILRNSNHLVKPIDFFKTENMDYEDNLHLMFEKEKKYEQLEQAIEILPDEQKKCILLFYIEKKTYQEIMQTTGMNYMQVKSNIQNGKRNLKIKMSEIQNNE